MNFSFYRPLKISYVFLLLVYSLSACNDTQIRTYSKKPAEAEKPSFVLTSLDSASKSKYGNATLEVTTPYEASVECVNCEDFPLNFVKTGGEGLVSVAKFKHVLVKKTYLCKRTLRISYEANNIVKDYVYGIYLCPENKRTGVRECDKANAEEWCKG